MQKCRAVCFVTSEGLIVADFQVRLIYSTTDLFVLYTLPGIRCLSQTTSSKLYSFTMSFGLGFWSESLDYVSLYFKSIYLHVLTDIVMD